MKFLIIITILFSFSCIEKVEQQEQITLSNNNLAEYIFYPTWVRRIIDENKINLSQKELNTLTLLDINGDSKIDAIFIRDSSLILIQKNGVVTHLDELKDEEEEVLYDYTWVDFWYIDDPLKSKEFPFVSSKGQVLILGKESSGIIAIYYDSKGFQWVGFD